MRFVLKIILSAGITVLLSTYLPFWASAVGILILNLIIRSGGLSSFFSGFFGMGLAWAAYAYFLSTGDAELINEKIAAILSVQSPELMFIISGFIGGITGGLSALTGQQMILKAKKTISKDNPYH